MLDWLRHRVPLSVRRPVYQWRMRRREAGGRLFCPVCQSAVRSFVPHGNPAQPNVRCPVCQSKACHRVSWAYFDAHPGLFSHGGVFLHIAPEDELGKWLRKRCRSAGMDYRCGDLRDRRHFIDIEETGLPDASIDVLFACHVLNMVRDDQRALVEIARVLKPGGQAILPVPIASAEGPLREARPESDEAERLGLFADPAMYRVYSGVEFEHRARSAGLSLLSFSARDIDRVEAAAWTLLDEPIQIVTRRVDPIDAKPTQ